MSGLAEVLRSKGFTVSGSDAVKSPVTASGCWIAGIIRTGPLNAVGLWICSARIAMSITGILSV